MRAPVRVVGYATLQLTTWITNRDVSKVTSSFAAMRHEATSLATELLITTSGPRERVRKRAAGEREREREREGEETEIAKYHGGEKRISSTTDRGNETESVSTRKMNGGGRERGRERRNENRAKMLNK